MNSEKQGGMITCNDLIRSEKISGQEIQNSGSYRVAFSVTQQPSVRSDVVVEHCLDDITDQLKSRDLEASLPVVESATETRIEKHPKILRVMQSDVSIVERTKLRILENIPKILKLTSSDDVSIVKTKLRILALHGTGGDEEATKLQLESLQITEDKYDIIFLGGHSKENHGISASGHPDDEIKTSSSYCQFLHNDHDTESAFSSRTLQASRYVWKAIQAMGPFDAIYGFAQGATIATIVACASSNSDFERLLMPESGRAPRNKKPSIGYMILACACDLPDLLLQESLQLQSKPEVNIPSLHLIATEDQRRNDSEDISRIFSDAQVHYIVGGHDAVNESMRGDAALLSSLANNLNALQNVPSIEIPKSSSVSEVSTISVLDDKQAVFVDLDRLISDATITKALKAQAPDRPLFYNAREIDKTKVTSYGDVLEFFQGGPGDLRRLGVKSGDVVAYCAPPGAASALAFLSIAAQTTSAPLAPSTSESDCLHFLKMYRATHIVIFDGVACPGVESASAILQDSGLIKVHRAVIDDHNKPGWFKFTGTMLSTSEQYLQNPSSGVALLLGTSGTTSKPKGVPLTQESIIHNGQILASTLGLRETDVCYSIMPLFHIGGISSSILCTLVSGGAVCCDNETFDAENMVDALALSEPQPTWYSAVPTIHNVTVSYIKDNANSMKLTCYGIDNQGVWEEGHSLRFIRSGAAALLGPDAKNLTTTYGNIPVYPTYSMSEQMPISQPPLGKEDMNSDKPGSVGVPVAASMAIVDTSTLMVLPYGQEGEIAISGPTVMKKYLSNPEADRKAFFELTFPLRGKSKFARNQYFLTGDTGTLDREGYLTLKGRNKEMIKKGGEQVSPFEVEEVLLSHPWIKTPLCFAVPSQLYGEEVGCALILSSSAPAKVGAKEVITQMRQLLSNSDLSIQKWPTRWKVVEDNDLPKTKSNKYIRIGLSEVLGINGDIDTSAPGEIHEGSEGIEKVACDKEEDNAYIDWNVISGFRFVLACYVMFMHVGSDMSWGAFSNLRGFPWHVHCFFTLGGFSMAAPMNPMIEKKFKYFLARVGNMYPMYVVAVFFTFANLLVSCRPSTFRPNFHWSSQPDDLYIDGDEANGNSPLFCEGTPVTPNSYWASLTLTIVVYLLGLTITPIWVAHWWMGYYFWFASMYYQCLMIFPLMYNRLFKHRGNTSRLCCIVVGLLCTNCIILFGAWFGLKDGKGYGLYNSMTTEESSVDEYNAEAYKHNAWVTGWYLFSPFWMLYFAIGGSVAFLYDAKRPVEQTSSYAWALVADGCTLVVVAWSIFVVMDGNVMKSGDELDLRPSEADHLVIDTAATVRIWSSIHGRILAPLTTLWIFALSTGKGYTAAFLRIKILAKWMSPHAYNCFLFHQMIAQWYYAATRNGQWWNWWSYRKTMYWFSPKPVPVDWYEYFAIVMLTVAFSALMQVTLEPIASSAMNSSKKFLCSNLFDDFDKSDLNESVHHAIEDLTGLSPQSDWTLGQSGLSSVGLPQLAKRLGNTISSTALPITINAKDLSDAETVGDIVQVLEESIHKKEYELDTSLRSGGSLHSKRSLRKILSDSFHRKKYNLNDGNNSDGRNLDDTFRSSIFNGSSRSLKSTSSRSLQYLSAHNHSIHRSNHDLEVGDSDEDTQLSHLRSPYNKSSDSLSVITENLLVNLSNDHKA